MDLNRQTLGREEEFDHDRRIVADGVREPDFAHAAITEIPKIAGNVDAPTWLVDDDRFEAGKPGGTMLGPSTAVIGNSSSRPIATVAVSPVPLIVPQTACIVDELVAAFIDRDRLEEVVSKQIKK